MTDFHLILSSCPHTHTHAGIEKDHFFITTDFQTDLFRAATATGGSVPLNNWLLDRLYSVVALVGLCIWRICEANDKIRRHAPDHAKALGLPART